MRERRRTLHDVWTSVDCHIIVQEVTRSTVKAKYVTYHYYIVRGGQRAGISRHAAVLLGVKV